MKPKKVGEKKGFVVSLEENGLVVTSVWTVVKTEVGLKWKLTKSIACLDAVCLTQNYIRGRYKLSSPRIWRKYCENYQGVPRFQQKY